MKSKQCLFKYFASTAIGLLLISGTGMAIAEPYAPVYTVPEGAAQHAEVREYQRGQRERIAAMVPARADVDVPPYPGAVVFLVHPEEQVAQMIGRGGFAEIKLLTADSIDQITAFYVEALPDWNFEAEYSLFWYGDGEFGLARLMKGMPHISVQPAGNMAGDLVPDAENLISIVYPTGKQD